MLSHVRSATPSSSSLLVTVALVCGWHASFAEAQEAAEHPLLPAIRVARQSLEACNEISDFQAIFSKQERIGRKLAEPEVMYVKLRREPFSVYLKFLKAHEGREVIYFEGRNEDNILAHEGGVAGLVGTIKIPVNSPRAMDGNRYPITRMGMRSLVAAVIEQWEAETEYGEIDVKYYPNAKLQGTECKVIQTSHPKPRREFEFHMTRLYIDKATNLPVRVEQYGFPSRAGERPPLVEQYTYSRVKVDNGFTDADFDPRNPKYAF